MKQITTVKLTYVFITINLIIASTIMVFLSGGLNGMLDFINDWYLNLGIGVLALYFSGYYIGKQMEILIKIRRINFLLVGVIGILIILLIGIFFGSTVGFLQEGIVNINHLEDLKDTLFDYYIKPLFWILFFGIIPTIISGLILGTLIKQYKP